ncbi:MAG: tetratricopeptide repeat protein [Microcoleaceae cyanobacterium]
MESKISWKESVKLLHQQVQACLTQRQFHEATALCHKFLTQYSESAEAYQMLGLIAQLDGNYQDALKAYQKALEIQPDFAAAYVNLGNLYAHQKFWDDALSTYQAALRLSPSLSHVYFRLGEVFSHLNQWQEAAIAYQQAIQLKANVAGSHLGLGSALAQQGQWERAILSYQKFLQLNPDSAIGYQKLGDAWFKLQRWDKAIHCYQKLLESSPKSVWAYQHLGKALIHQQQWDEAIIACQKAIEININSAWSYSNLGDAFVQKEQFEDAVLAYIQAIYIKPNRFQPGVLNTIYRNLGYALRQQTQANIQQLIESYRHVFQSNLNEFSTRSFKFYLHLGQALAKCHQFEGAILFHQLALDAQPDCLEIQTQLHNVLQQQQEFKQNLAKYYTEIQQNPNCSDAYKVLGNILSEQGRETEAISYHQTSLALRGWHLSQVRQYQFTRDWFSANMPIWRESFNSLANQSEISVLEIGSFQGMSTCWFLDHILTHPTARITCIDPYFKPEFDPNIAKTGAAHKVTKLIGYSQDILKTLDAGSYDLVYIDGCHLASVALRDTLQSWPLAKVGGLIVFDDYDVLEDDPEQTAKAGIDSFLKLVEAEVEVVYQGYQLIIQKRSPALTPEEISQHLSQIPQDDQLRW